MTPSTEFPCRKDTLETAVGAMDDGIPINSLILPVHSGARRLSDINNNDLNLTYCQQRNIPSSRSKYFDSSISNISVLQRDMGQTENLDYFPNQAIPSHCCDHIQNGDSSFVSGVDFQLEESSRSGGGDIQPEDALLGSGLSIRPENSAHRCDSDAHQLNAGVSGRGPFIQEEDALLQLGRPSPQSCQAQRWLDRDVKRLPCHGQSFTLKTAVQIVLVCSLAISLQIPTASASCTKGVTELWAYTNPSFEEFQDSYNSHITSSKGSVCRWIVIASHEDWGVNLRFDPFQLKQSTDEKKGDCVEIYNGDSTEAPLLDRVCDGKPATYKSDGRHLFVVYRRGQVQGERKIGFHYIYEDDDSKEELIRIAGIVGGSIAAVGVIYLIVRFTDCFGCFSQKDGDSTLDQTRGSIGHANYERDRLTLTLQVMEDGGGGTRTESSGETSRLGSIDSRTALAGAAGSNAVSNAHDNNVIGSRGDLVARENSTGVVVDTNLSGGSDSESDSSLQTLDELPPSYESLYLDGDGIEPPQYSPPRHRAKNPPRRVHTFN